jgi:dynein heavy chain, axonemal
VRDCAEALTPDRKWIIFDGPVDAIWIENMNTVLDDNKKLCLNSGQIIKLKPTMTMMFEVEDLSQASPATVSRCGMVLMEPQQLGHQVQITSYCQQLPEYHLEEKLIKKIDKLMTYVCALCMEFTRINCKFPVVTGPNFLVHNFLRVFDHFIVEWKAEDSKGAPGNADDICFNAIVFAGIWGIGCQIEETTRPKFDKFFQLLIQGEDVQEQFKIDIPKVDPMKVPNKVGGEVPTLFELAFVKDQVSWMHWTKTIPTYVVPKDCTYSEVIVPNVDSIRVRYCLNQLLMQKKHVLIVGETGTGKSIMIQQELKENFQNDDYMFLGLAFSAQTSANQTQLIIDGGMEKKRKGFYGPPLGKDGIIFVDDLNMPQKEVYFAQPPIELLRQWMDYGGWYDIDTPEREFRYTQKVSFVAAMAAAGRQTITNRYVRHFNIIYVEPYSNESMN